MAIDRTNMVSLLDIGKYLGGDTSSIVMLGDGFKELNESWGPDVQSTQYINMKNKASTLKGYEFSTTIEREYLDDSTQEVIDNAFKKFPTGAAAETYYYRFYKTDLTTSSGSATGDCIRIPVVVAPSSTGGAGGDVLVSSLSLTGNGDVQEGTITISAEGSYSWAAK